MCEFCQNHEQGDTLYESSDWDGGIGFDYIRDIKYCPICGNKLNSEDELQTQLTAKCLECNNSKACKENHWDGCIYEPLGYEVTAVVGTIKDELQTEPLQTCSVNGRPYSECSSCEHFRCTADEPQTERSE